MPIGASQYIGSNRGSSAAGWTESIVSEDQDRDRRCRAREPQAGTATDARQRLETANCQTEKASFQGSWSDLDRGEYLRMAWSKPAVQQRLRVLCADLRDHDRHC